MAQIKIAIQEILQPKKQIPANHHHSQANVCGHFPHNTNPI